MICPHCGKSTFMVREGEDWHCHFCGWMELAPCIPEYTLLPRGTFGLLYPPDPVIVRRRRQAA